MVLKTVLPRLCDAVHSGVGSNSAVDSAAALGFEHARRRESGRGLRACATQPISGFVPLSHPPTHIPPFSQVQTKMTTAPSDFPCALTPTCVFRARMGRRRSVRKWARAASLHLKPECVFGVKRVFGANASKTKTPTRSDRRSSRRQRRLCSWQKSRNVARLRCIGNRHHYASRFRHARDQKVSELVSCHGADYS